MNEFSAIFNKNKSLIGQLKIKLFYHERKMKIKNKFN